MRFKFLMCMIGLCISLPILGAYYQFNGSYSCQHGCTRITRQTLQSDSLSDLEIQARELAHYYVGSSEVGGMNDLAYRKEIIEAILHRTKSILSPYDPDVIKTQEALDVMLNAMGDGGELRDQGYVTMFRQLNEEIGRESGKRALEQAARLARKAAGVQ